MIPAEMRKETTIVLAQTQETYQEVLQVADNLYRQDPDWVTFFREVLGIDGIVRRKFPSFEDLTKFEQTDEFDRIQKMLVKLREKRNASDPETEPTRVITVRLPKSMHEYLRTEAHDLRTSMNKLCISKLLQVIGEEMIPNERSAIGETTSAPAPRPVTNNHATSSSAGTTPFNQPTQQAPQGGYQPGLQSTQQPQTATMPFKPSQPRF
jgi:predicted HicB family RNase H-like nuclease